MLKKFFGVFALIVALNFSVASAEIITVEGTGRYLINRGSGETFDVAQEFAYTDALRNVVEHAGVALQSYSRTKNFELEIDVIETAAGAVLEIVGKPNFHNGDTNNNQMEIVCDITARVDTDKVEKVLADKNLLAERASKDKYILKLATENQRLKKQIETAADNQQNKIRNELERNQNLFLIAKYERDLDIYDSKKINLQDMMSTAEKLAALDAGNVSAFQAKICVYRREDRIQNAVDYCKQMLDANISADISIEACAQLGDIYYNEIFDTPTAKKFVDRGIALVKEKYSPEEIERLVNGTNVEIDAFVLSGRSNTIRELYVLKSDIEDVNPDFDSESEMEDLTLTKDRIYNIKYPTNW